MPAQHLVLLPQHLVMKEIPAKMTTIPATAQIRIRSGDASQARVISACRSLLRVLISSHGEIAVVSDLKIGNKPPPRA